MLSCHPVCALSWMPATVASLGRQGWVLLSVCEAVTSGVSGVDQWVALCVVKRPGDLQFLPSHCCSYQIKGSERTPSCLSSP